MARKKQPQQPKEREPWTPWGKWAKRRRERIEARKRAREERKLQRRLRWRRRVRRFRLFTSRSIVFIGLGIFTCLIGFIVILVIGKPYPWQTFADVTNSINAGRELDDHRDRWDSLGIEHYTVEVEYSQEGAICGPVTLEIENGEVVESPEASELWIPEETCNELLDQLTVESAFTQLDTLLNNFRPSIDLLRIVYNDEFGYPSSIRVGTYENEPPNDCCWQAEWRNLRPINDNLDE